MSNLFLDNNLNFSIEKLIISVLNFLMFSDQAPIEARGQSQDPFPKTNNKRTGILLDWNKCVISIISQFTVILTDQSFTYIKELFDSLHPIMAS